MGIGRREIQRQEWRGGRRVRPSDRLNGGRAGDWGEGGEAGQGTAEHEQGGDEEGSWLDDDWVVPQTAEEANEMWGPVRPPGFCSARSYAPPPPTPQPPSPPPTHPPPLRRRLTAPTSPKPPPPPSPPPPIDVPTNGDNPSRTTTCRTEYMQIDPKRPSLLVRPGTTTPLLPHFFRILSPC